MRLNLLQLSKILLVTFEARYLINFSFRLLWPPYVADADIIFYGRPM